MNEVHLASSWQHCTMMCALTCGAECLAGAETGPVVITVATSVETLINYSE